MSGLLVMYVRMHIDGPRLVWTEAHITIVHCLIANGQSRSLC